MGLHGVSKKLACPVNRSRRAGMQGIEQQVVVEHYATCGEAINMWGLHLMAAVEGQVVAVERIEHDKECFHGGLPLRCILQTVQIICW